MYNVHLYSLSCANQSNKRCIYNCYLVFNAQLVPENPELITDIIFSKDGDAQVIIPANAIIHQRATEGK